MSWTAVAAAPGSWTTSADAAKTHVVLRPVIRSWAMVSRQMAGPDDGVDFELRFREPYGWLMAETQPQRLLESGLSEGRP